MSRGTRTFGTAAFLLGLVNCSVGSWMAWQGDAETSSVALVIGLVCSWFAVSAGIRPMITMSRDGLRIRNIVFEYDVPWGAVRGVTAGMRVELATVDGGSVEAWAVQRTNLAAMLGRESRVDRVAATIAAEWHAAAPTAAHVDVRRRLVPVSPWAVALSVAAIAVPAAVAILEL